MDNATLMYGPFIVTAHNVQACITAGDKGDLVARKVMWGINTWLSRGYPNRGMRCVCPDCPKPRQSFSQEYQPAAFLVMLPLRDDDDFGLIVAACEHCTRQHAGNLQHEMERALQCQYPELIMQPQTLH